MKLTTTCECTVTTWLLLIVRRGRHIDRAPSGPTNFLSFFVNINVHLFSSLYDLIQLSRVKHPSLVDCIGRCFVTQIGCCSSAITVLSGYEMGGVNGAETCGPVGKNTEWA